MRVQHASCDHQLYLHPAKRMSIPVWVLPKHDHNHHRISLLFSSRRAQSSSSFFANQAAVVCASFCPRSFSHTHSEPFVPSPKRSNLFRFLSLSTTHNPQNKETSKMSTTSTESRDDALFMAKLAEQSERYEDMVTCTRPGPCPIHAIPYTHTSRIYE